MKQMFERETRSQVESGKALKIGKESHIKEPPRGRIGAVNLG